jgi:hypothetical protein
MPLHTDLLRTLHRIHRQLGDLRERLERGPKQVQAHAAAVARSEKQLQQAKDEVKSAKMLADQKQLQLKTSDAKIKDLERKLQAVGSNREYQALLEQIAADKMASSVLEDEILEVLGRIDSLARTVKESEQVLAKARDEAAKAEQAVKSQAESLQNEVARLEAELKQVEGALPGDLRDGYLRIIKSRGSDGMAQLENDSCGGCYQQLPPNKLNQVRLGEVVFCPSCGRLLYLPEGWDNAARKRD